MNIMKAFPKSRGNNGTRFPQLTHLLIIDLLELLFVSSALIYTFDPIYQPFP